MLWMDLEETNKPMSSAHRVSVNSRGPRTKPCEYWWQKARGEVLVLLTQERAFYCFFCLFVFRTWVYWGWWKKWSCRVVNATWVFFTTVANDEDGHPPVPLRSPQHYWLMAESIWAEAKIFCVHLAGCHSLSRIDGPTVFEPEPSD